MKLVTTLAVTTVSVILLLFVPPDKQASAVLPIRELKNPAIPGSKAPSLTLNAKDTPLLAWVEPAGSTKVLKFAFWDSHRWSAPRTVVQNPTIDADSAAPPFVVELPGGAFIAVWSQSVGDDQKNEGNFLLASASTTEGKTWSAPVRIHTDQSISEHSFDSIAATASDEATIVWLDSRADKSQHRYQLMSVVIDAKGHLRHEETIDPDTCTCCPTAFASTQDAAVVVYRGHNSQEIRDIKIARRTSGKWDAPSLVHDDLWKINGCPVNGPALSLNGSHLAVVWFTGAGDKAEIRLARSDDLGRTFQPPVALSTQESGSRPLGHVAVTLLDSGTMVVAWLQRENGATRLVARTISPSNVIGQKYVIDAGTEQGLGYPRIQRMGKSAMITWSGKTGADVRTAVIGEVQ